MPANKEIAPRRDIHAEITDKLIAAIETDPGKPCMPWRRSGKPLFMPVNALTDKPYNGINIVSLWVSAEIAGYSAPVWATYKQWREIGCQVRKSEKSSLVVFYKEYETDPNPDEADDDGKRRVARASHVFNAGQVDGYAMPDAPTPLGPVERLEAVDRFIAATGARIEHGGDRAFYRPSTDHIQMPDEGLFCGTDTMTRDEAYYAVLAHELTH
jgi:antirestriction protein ArdC